MATTRGSLFVAPSAVARVSRARRASCPRVCARGVDTLVDSRVARRVDGSRAAVVARARARVVIARASASRLAPQQTHIDGVDAYVSRMADFVPPSAAAAALSAFALTAMGFMIGCLVTLREVVRACREATLASRAVRNCANSIDGSCSSVDRCTTNIDETCSGIDDFLVQASTIGMTTNNILTEAGLLQRRVTELPNALIGALGDATEPPPPRSVLASREGESVEEVARRDIVLGKEITGRRLGNGWIGSTMHRFFFSRENTFEVGEYVAVKRSNNTYTWGVIEMTDSGESEHGEELNGVEASRDSVLGDSIESEAATCAWPMRDLPAEEAAKQIEEANQITVGKVFRALIRMPIPKSLGETERQYRVVVELDRDLYRFKYVDASLLGKRY